ncbi:unnamed protein product (macronuclear) [Paramecium tetraurelia]|uniref:Histidine kinase n=1 Tax=Paramecium tetraurelia TaxID=5888 RepID=A0C6Q3_PARTE|nr:uncharacterized protein GSPATT00035599001 [Paramecium tetraurelia]CAK66470.1 unnamed protein product [Paramecium tetraurelia]|eukprot:XP_001433867.1 hypothetical protein (macronuclear) [Paramecium tetraurelia strain d4-2]
MPQWQIIWKTFYKHLKILRWDQYQQWRWHNHFQWADTTFKPILILQFIFIIIRLSILADNLYIQITLATQICIHILLFLSFSKAISEESHFFIQFLPLIQQYCMYWICYIIKEKDYFMLYVTLITIYQSMYSTLHMKFMTIILFLIQNIFLADLPSFEGLFISTALLILQILRKEFLYLQHFQNLQALFMIIDSTPQAMCIVHKDKNFMLYSNKIFDNLANKLESTNQGETDQSPEKSSTVHSARNQLSFLQNLQLDELNNNQTLFDFDDEDLEMEDQYKIKNVTYCKEKTQLLSQNRFSVEIQQLPPKSHQQQQKFFQSFKNQEDESIIKKKFTSDVTMKIEFNNSPQININSAGKKSSRKRSQNQIRLNRSSVYATPSRKISVDQLLSKESKEHRNSNQKQSLFDQDLNITPRSNPTINHKMKFLVNVLENCRIFDNDDGLQIYFINEINQILLRAKLKKLESIKKNILRSISHELLTNLNAIFGFIKQCQDKQSSKESCALQLEQALCYTKLQLYKIYDFFDYRDILEERLIMKSDKFELNSVIWECVDLLKDQIERKLISIKVKLPEVSYIILGDRQRLCQVLLNLIANAIRFTLKGGITIQVEKKQYIESMQGIDDVQSFHQSDSNLIQVSISDTGIGMSEQELYNLRKKLHLADDDEKVSKQSVGISLGLSVCKYIVKHLAPMHQNYLSVESQLGVGSQFYFVLQYDEEQVQFEQSNLQNSFIHTIPFLEQQSTQQVRVLNYNKFGKSQIGDQLKSLDTNICKCKKTLIVDDEQFNIHILSHIVKQLGYDVDYAFNGQQAIEKIEVQLANRCNTSTCIGYKCILMDINMPIMSGWEAVQRIRQMEYKIKLTRTIPIIAVTAFCSIQDQQKSIHEGFNSVLIKPITKEKLCESFHQFNI